MMPLFRTSFEVEGLAPYRALDKLAKRGISVFGVQKLSPTRLKMRVKSKEMQKVFAIFSGSCYTVTKVRRESFSRLRAALLRRLWLLTAVMALAARSSWGLLARFLPERWAVLPAILIAAAVYILLALATGAVTRQELLALPKGEKIAQILGLR